MVRVHLDPPVRGWRSGPLSSGGCEGLIPDGAIAQLGEHLLCKQGVAGSIPAGSTMA